MDWCCFENRRHITTFDCIRCQCACSNPQNSARHTLHQPKFLHSKKVNTGFWSLYKLPPSQQFLSAPSHGRLLKTSTQKTTTWQINLLSSRALPNQASHIFYHSLQLIVLPKCCLYPLKLFQQHVINNLSLASDHYYSQKFSFMLWNGVNKKPTCLPS